MNDFKERLLFAITNNSVDNYLINITKSDTEELFFIKKELSVSRNKNVTKYEVNIYKDFKIDNKMMRGNASFIIDSNLSDAELDLKIKEAIKSASSVNNPFYELAAKSSDIVESKNVINSNITTDYTASDIANFIYLNDNYEDAFINSLEVFVENKTHNIINSNGINIIFSEKIYKGEYVLQCKTKEDVELYQDFIYSSYDTDIEKSLCETINKNLKNVRNRSFAVPIDSVENLKYDNIILEGNCVYDLFSYYLNRLDASMIYPGYSNFKVGDLITKDKISGDFINIRLMPKKQYSNEGIKLSDSILIKDSIATTLTGDLRFSYYLNIPAIGTYSSYKLECGNTPINTIEKGSYLKIVNFSDFQMDPFTGQFGGEYRLAYYNDGNQIIPVTNGSISGNINDIINNIILSKEEFKTYSYNGPLAISYKA